MINNFPFTKQLESRDCGPACLSMVAKYYGQSYNIHELRNLSNTAKDGTSLLGLSDAAEKIGFKRSGVKLSYNELLSEVNKPCIAHWNQNHFVVIYKIIRSKRKISFVIGDPARGIIKLSEKEFLKGWGLKNKSNNTGICLLLETTSDFKSKKPKTEKKSFRFLIKYIKPYRKYIIQLILGLLLGSFFQVLFPILTQSIVDIGIKNNDLNFITLILIAQLVLIFSQTSLNFIRSWILLHISTRINISLISDFLAKLMKLSLGFFDSRLMGDLMQRISDHDRIESFLTNSLLQILFSTINLIVFAIVLGFYNFNILLITLIGTISYIIWIIIFLKRRRNIDYKRFDLLSDNNDNLIQLISGMPDIKLNNCEKRKRNTWETIQSKLFKVNIKGLALNQYQQAGGTLIVQSQNIIITFIAAEAVILNNMTLGMMLAIQYIIGQINAPIEQIIGFTRSAQDAKISLERLNEIHSKPNENSFERNVLLESKYNNISIQNLYFQYGGENSPFVLKNISLLIPAKKVTAIVGTSGSGKTTFIKLLLGFYKCTKGVVNIGNTNLNNIFLEKWRESIGVVMQDGYLFSDTIANNIALSDNDPDASKLNRAISIANIDSFINSLPLGLNTMIGQNGTNLSQGQKQRILIARAVYKDPDYIFFDEATNALDSYNEKEIINNLDNFFIGRTVIIVAHRLSTVKNADQIIVLDKGELVETGNHQSLKGKKGAYYHLIKNQLELGN